MMSVCTKPKIERTESTLRDYLIRIYETQYQTADIKRLTDTVCGLITDRS